MSREGNSSSDENSSTELKKKHYCSGDEIESLGRSQTHSPVPSCLSMNSDGSMRLPTNFNNSRDGDRSHEGCGPPMCKFPSRGACICSNTCRGRTHKRMHAQPCACCGGSILPCCQRQSNPQNLLFLLLGITAAVISVYCMYSQMQGLQWFWSQPSVIEHKAEIHPGESTNPLQEVRQELRVMLLGWSGAGKSSSGNTILGKLEFEEYFSLIPVTKECEMRRSVISGRKITVIDTPGVSDPSFLKCFHNTSSVHAFLLVLRLGRITPEEGDGIKHIREVIGSGALKHTLVLFTGGDLLGGRSFSEMLDHSPPVLKEIISSCEGGYHVFNNKNRTDVRQVEELLLKIEAAVYKNSLYNKAVDTVNNALDTTNVPEPEKTGYSIFTICVILFILACLIVVIIGQMDNYEQKTYVTDDMKTKHKRKEKT